MMSFAKLYFVEPISSAAPSQKSTLKSKLTFGRKRDRGESLSWGWASVVQKVKHSTAPITTTLTRIHDEDENEMCLEIFKSEPIFLFFKNIFVSSQWIHLFLSFFFSSLLSSVIMRYMGDLPSKVSQPEIVKSVVSKGVARPSIRDEIFCQIVKQVTGHPSRGT